MTNEELSDDLYARSPGWAATGMVPLLDVGQEFECFGVTWEVAQHFPLPCCGEIMVLVRRKGSNLSTWNQLACEQHPEAGSWTVEGLGGLRT